MHRWLNGFALVCAGLFLLGYFGALSPAFDAVAIGRWVALWAALGLTVLAALMQRRLGLAAALIATGLSVQWLATPITAPHPVGPDTVRVYTKNLLFLNADLAPIQSDIRRQDPDILFLQEMSYRTMPLIETLSDVLPHHQICPFQGWNGMAVLSKHPLDGPPRCSPIRSLMVVRVGHQPKPFWAVDVHLQHAWPDLQWAHLELALPVLEGLDGPAIVAGDFNTMHWAEAPRLIGRLTQTLPLAPTFPTYRLGGIGLPLDHIWAPSGVARLRPKFSSDHNGLAADVGL